MRRTRLPTVSFHMLRERHGLPSLGNPGSSLEGQGRHRKEVFWWVCRAWVCIYMWISVFWEPWIKVRSCCSARFLFPLLLCLCTVLYFLWCLSCTCPRTNIYCTMRCLEKFQFSIFLSESRVCPGFSSGNVVMLNYSLEGRQEVTTPAPHLGVYSGSSSDFLALSIYPNGSSFWGWGSKLGGEESCQWEKLRE